VPALILALLAGGSLLSVMASQGLGDLLVPVSVYALAISAMLWRALARLGSSVANVRPGWPRQAP
jgi:YhhN-like protein.